MRSSTCTKKRQRGATLLEIICSLTLLSLGVFASMQVFHQSAQHTLFLAQEQRALRILENEIERLRALPFAELPVAEEIPLRAGAEELAPLAEARGSVTISDAPAVPGLHEVRVELSWRGPQARRISRSLSTQIAEAEEVP